MRRFAWLILFWLLTGPLLAETVTGAQGVSLNSPPGWSKVSAPEGAAIVLLSPDKLTRFQPNVNVMIQDTGQMSHDQYMALSEKQGKEAGGTVTEYGPFTFDDGVEGRSLVFSFTVKGMPLRCLSVWQMAGGKTYLITGTTLAENFEQRRATFAKIAGTFKR